MAQWTNTKTGSDTLYSSTNQGGPITLTPITQTKLLVNYYSNYATEASDDALNEVGADKNVIIKTVQFGYGTTYENGHWNYSTKGGSAYLARAGYSATGFWGTELEGGILVNQDPANPITGKKMAEELGLNIENSDQEINLYAQWSYNYFVYFKRDNEWVPCRPFAAHDFNWKEIININYVNNLT